VHQATGRLCPLLLIAALAVHCAKSVPRGPAEHSPAQIPTATIPSAAAQAPTTAETTPAPCAAWPRYEPTPLQRERDEIFSLLAYAVALKDWQQKGPGGRGLNVAAVLVDPERGPVCWARQAVRATGNVTQHAEVVLATTFLHNTRSFNLKGYRVYVTLEPCAMCAGTLLMARADAVIYGQKAGGSGDALAHLARDSSTHGGSCPYPYAITAAEAPSEFPALLQRAAHVHGAGDRHFLLTDAARKVYEKAAAKLAGYGVRESANASTLVAAQRFLQQVPASYLAAPYAVACPPPDSALSRRAPNSRTTH